MKKMLLILSALALPLIHAQSTADASTASIRGMQVKSRVWYDHTACVASIDRQAIKDDKELWNNDLQLAPGRHLIAVRYYHYTYTAGHLFVLEVKPNVKYQVNCKYLDDQVELWIEDLSSGKPATEVSRVHAVGPIEFPSVSDTRLIRD